MRAPRRKKPQRKLARRPARARRVASRKQPVAPIKGAPQRWNPDPEDVQRSVIKLVLSLVEFIRKLMERQALRRLEAQTLTPEEIENVGLALMRVEQTVEQIAKRFKLSMSDLNLDLGPIGRLH